ncbi:MAG: cation-translocating P-type ATPase, partial [Gordonia sp. (in: high G+C Gram-positive bacteria)]
GHLATNPGDGVATVANASQTLGAVQTQAATAALVTMISIALYVLAVVARPYNWWKIVLLAVSVGMYVLIFTVPFSQRLFHLDSSNGHMMTIAAVCAIVGCIAIEVSTRVLSRILARTS